MESNGIHDSFGQIPFAENLSTKPGMIGTVSERLSIDPWKPGLKPAFLLSVPVGWKDHQSQTADVVQQTGKISRFRIDAAKTRELEHNIRDRLGMLP